MTRKDFIVVAEAMAVMIRLGYIKKKDIDNSIYEMNKKLAQTNGAYSFSRFEDYVKESV